MKTKWQCSPSWPTPLKKTTCDYFFSYIWICSSRVEDSGSSRDASSSVRGSAPGVPTPNGTTLKGTLRCFTKVSLQLSHCTSWETFGFYLTKLFEVTNLIFIKLPLNYCEHNKYLLEVSTIIAFSIEDKSLGSPAVFQLWILMSDPRTFWKLNVGEQGTLSSLM